MATDMTKRTVRKLGQGHCGRLAGELEFRALRMDWDSHVALLISHRSPGPIGQRSWAVARSVEFEVVSKEKEGTEFEVDPTLKLTGAEAAQLMDELWRAGVRPAELHGSVGQLGAVEKHLADMRAIVAQALDVSLPTRFRE